MSPLFDRQEVVRHVEAGRVRLGWQETKCAKCNAWTRVAKSAQTVKCSGCGLVLRQPEKGWFTKTVAAGYFVLNDVPELHKAFPGQPTRLPVTMPFRTPDENLSGFYIAWTTLPMCRGDGRQVLDVNPFEIRKKPNKEELGLYTGEGEPQMRNGEILRPFKWGEQEFRPGMPAPRCPGIARNLYPHCMFCTENTLLRFRVWSEKVQMRYAFYQVGTRSDRNYTTLWTVLKELYDTYGQCSGIPMHLYILKEQTSYMDGNKRRRTIQPFLKLEPTPEFARAATQRHAVALLESIAPAVPQLTAPQEPLVAPVADTLPYDVLQNELQEYQGQFGHYSNEEDEEEFRDAELVELRELTDDESVWLDMEPTVKRMLDEATGHGLAKEEVEQIWKEKYGERWGSGVQSNRHEAWALLTFPEKVDVPHPWPAALWQKRMRALAAESKMRGGITKGSAGKPGQLAKVIVLFKQEADLADDERRSVLRYLFDKPSIGELTKAEAHVLIDEAEKAKATWKAECAGMLKMALIEAGQQELEGLDG